VGFFGQGGEMVDNRGEGTWVAGKEARVWTKLSNSCYHAMQTHCNEFLIATTY
jgi:7-cyano-7-deazaguanine synthase in queuosine biosynthesis